jgi:dihydroorotate dehydrogenase electron transfer subunit
MLQVKAKLIYNKRINHNYFRCALEARGIAKAASPGKFVNIKLSDAFDPFLRRPFSIHRVRSESIEILYEVVGKGSGILSQKKTGEYLDIIGPLGNGFSMPPAGRSILVAGGMGVAPLLFLAERMNCKKCASSARVLIGARTKKQILCKKEFKDLGCEIKVATDDGSKGFKGKVTDLLKNILRPSAIGHRPSAIYACGPKPMLKEISAISNKYKIPAQICLEEHMACGIGACLGCVVDTKQGFKRTCKEGPVFLADEIIW